MSRLVETITDPHKTAGASYAAVISSSLDFKKSFDVKLSTIFKDNIHASYYVVLWGLPKPMSLTEMVTLHNTLLQIRLTRIHLELEKLKNFPPLETVFNRRFKFDFENHLDEEHGDFYFGIGLWLNRVNEREENTRKRYRDEIESEYCFLGDNEYEIEDLLSLSETEEEIIDSPVACDESDFATYHRLNKTFLDY